MISRPRISLSVILSLGLWPALSPDISAQSIAVDQLGAADLFDAGILNASNGGLDRALWQGTSAQRATELLAAMPKGRQNLIVTDLLHAVLLSEGVPPKATTESAAHAYDAARLNALMNMENPSLLNAMLARNPRLMAEPNVKAELALVNGDTDQACRVTDSVLEGRAKPVWAKRRAFCHILRDEAAAAELTVGLLKSDDIDDETYFTLMDVLLGYKNLPKSPPKVSTALHRVMAVKAGVDISDIAANAMIAIDEGQASDARLSALFVASHILSDAELKSVLSGLAFDEDDLLGSQDFTQEGIWAAPAPRAMGQLYTVAERSQDPTERAFAVTELLTRAHKNGAFDRFAAFLTPQIKSISPDLQAETNLDLFTRAAISRSDIVTLQGLYRALPDGSASRARLALVADSIGNGFLLGGLGQDIEMRLQDEGAGASRAVRDAFLALAMGARISGASGPFISQAGRGKGYTPKAGELLMLRSAAKAGSRAELALMAATMLAQKETLDDASLAQVVESLNAGGLTTFAGRIAAEDFAAGLK